MIICQYNAGMLLLTLCTDILFHVEKSEKETVIALPDTMESNIVAKGKIGRKATIVRERNVDQKLMTGIVIPFSL